MTHNILVVDDESVTRRVVYHALRPIDVAVLDAGNGAEALAVAKENTLGLAIVDINLPDMDGFEVMRQLQTIQPSLAMIMFTARSYPGDEVTAREAGAVDFLYKPFSTQELRELVQKYLPD